GDHRQRGTGAGGGADYRDRRPSREEVRRSERCSVHGAGWKHRGAPRLPGPAGCAGCCRHRLGCHVFPSGGGAGPIPRGPARNPVGWIFLGIAVFTGLPGIALQYVFRSAHFGRLPFVPWVAWTHDWVEWLVFPTGLATFFFLLFPDGDLPSARWRWLARVA